MGILNFFRSSDMEQGLQEYRETAGALLIDVRTAQEYRGGHIAGSVNIPLQELERIQEEAEWDTPLFVYCRSGGRSRQAAMLLKRMGYTRVKNLGGIEQ